MQYIELQASVSRTSAANGSGVAINGVTGPDYTLVLEIESLTATSGTPQVQFTIEDSVNAFTNQIVVATFNMQGAVNQDGKQHARKLTWRKRDLIGLRAGTASAVLRVSLASISANSTVKYKAYLQVVK